MSKHSILGLSNAKGSTKPARGAKSGQAFANPFGKLKPSTVGTLGLALVGLIVVALVVAIASGGNNDGGDSQAAHMEGPDPVNPDGLDLEVMIGDLGSAANTDGETADDESEPAVREPRFHEVQPGETLSHISAKYYGTAHRYDAIMAANDIDDPGSIRPGQSLEIPYLPEDEPRGSSTAATSGSPSTPLQGSSSSTPPAWQPDGTSGSSGSDTGNAGATPVDPEDATLLTWEGGSDAAQLADVPASVHSCSRGDTFFTLARKYYGDIAYWELIRDANPNLSPRDLREGQRVIVPALKRSRERTEPAPDAGTDRGSDWLVGGSTDGGRPGASGDGTYTVQSGDSLSVISQKVYGTSREWRRIADANDINDPASIRVGQVLVIPAR